jgi:hypothetical protein
MAKKQSNGRKPSGAAGIATIEDAPEFDQGIGEVSQASPEVEAHPPKAKKGVKAKGDQHGNGDVSLGDIRKAAGFVNSVGGLDKAFNLLQILKVAKEVQ